MGCDQNVFTESVEYKSVKHEVKKASSGILL